MGKKASKTKKKQKEIKPLKLYEKLSRLHRKNITLTTSDNSKTETATDLDNIKFNNVKNWSQMSYFFENLAKKISYSEMLFLIKKAINHFQNVSQNEELCKKLITLGLHYVDDKPLEFTYHEKLFLYDITIEFFKDDLSKVFFYTAKHIESAKKCIIENNNNQKESNNINQLIFLAVKNMLLLTLRKSYQQKIILSNEDIVLANTLIQECFKELLRDEDSIEENGKNSVITSINNFMFASATKSKKDTLLLDPVNITYITLLLENVELVRKHLLSLKNSITNILDYFDNILDKYFDTFIEKIAEFSDSFPPGLSITTNDLLTEINKLTKDAVITKENYRNFEQLCQVIEKYLTYINLCAQLLVIPIYKSEIRQHPQNKIHFKFADETKAALEACLHAFRLQTVKFTMPAVDKCVDQTILKTETVQLSQDMAENNEEKTQKNTRYVKPKVAKKTGLKKKNKAAIPAPKDKYPETETKKESEKKECSKPADPFNEYLKDFPSLQNLQNKIKSQIKDSLKQSGETRKISFVEINDNNAALQQLNTDNDVFIQAITIINSVEIAELMLKTAFDALKNNSLNLHAWLETKKNYLEQFLNNYQALKSLTLTANTSVEEECVKTIECLVDFYQDVGIEMQSMSNSLETLLSYNDKVSPELSEKIAKVDIKSLSGTSILIKPAAKKTKTSPGTSVSQEPKTWAQVPKPNQSFFNQAEFPAIGESGAELATEKKKEALNCHRIFSQNQKSSDLYRSKSEATTHKPAQTWQSYVQGYQQGQQDGMVYFYNQICDQYLWGYLNNAFHYLLSGGWPFSFYQLGNTFTINVYLHDTYQDLPPPGSDLIGRDIVVLEHCLVKNPYDKLITYACESPLVSGYFLQAIDFINQQLQQEEVTYKANSFST